MDVLYMPSTSASFGPNNKALCDQFLTAMGPQFAYVIGLDLPSPTAVGNPARPSMGNSCEILRIEQVREGFHRKLLVDNALHIIAPSAILAFSSCCKEKIDA